MVQLLNIQKKFIHLILSILLFDMLMLNQCQFCTFITFNINPLLDI